jgi:hypothetical protein
LAGSVTAVLYEEMEEHLDLRSRLAEGDFKPPRGALAEDLVNMSAETEPELARCPRCCTSRWRNLWTSGVALREEASNHLPGPWLKTVVLNGAGKGVAVTASGVGREDERWAERPSAG